MNRLLAYSSLLIFGLLSMTLIVVWLATPTLVPPPPHPQIAPVSQHLLPKVRLPIGADPDGVALRHAILNGERIYQRLCYHCHGRQGKGDNNAYMASIGYKPADHSDPAQNQKLSDKEYFLALRNGVKDERGWPTMPPWESVLTSRQMRDVIAYVRHLSPAPSPSKTP